MLEKEENGQDLYMNFSKTIEDYNLLSGIDNLIYLFSGGKDATIGIDFLQRYLIEHRSEITLEVLMITYPKHVYYEENGSHAKCYTDTINYWNNRGIELTIFNPKEDDFSEDDISACKICKNTRKNYVDPFLKEYQNKNLGKVVGVVTGYTLYDALAYTDEILLVSDFHSNSIESDIKTKNRVLNCLHKMKAREDLPNGLVVIRPLINMHENKIMNYVSENKIPYVNRKCIAAKDKHKRAYFKTLNVATPINNTDYNGLLHFLDKLGIKFPDNFEDIQLGNYFTDC